MDDIADRARVEEFEGELLDLSSRFSEPERIIQDLNGERFEFGYDVGGLVSIYHRLRRGILMAARAGDRNLSGDMNGNLLYLWDLQTAFHVLREHQGLGEMEIDSLEGNKLIEQALEYAQENRYGHLARILDARDKVLKTIDKYCKSV